MSEVNERHTYVIPGVSREVFTNAGVRMTTADDTLSYFVHAHQYCAYNSIPCTSGCTVVRKGVVEPVTRTADANAQSSV